MKRQLSLVLALVMILGTFTTVFAADTNPVDAVKVASDFLVKNEVLVGDADGNLMLDENLSRQDTVVLVSKLMGEFDVASEFPTAEGIPTYEDIADNFYLPLLAWAQANETFVGHSDAKFGFGDNLTAQEYAKVLLVALDYTVSPNGDADVKWENALAKAKDLGILADVDVKDADELLRGQMAVMTFNALGVKMNGSDKTLAEKLGIEMPAAEVLEAKVYSENLKEVVVEFNAASLVDKAKLEDVKNYRMTGFAFEKATLDGDKVVLLIADVKDSDGEVTEVKSLVKGRKYDVVLRNLDKNVNKKYDFTANDNTIPAVEKVTVLGEYGIKVTTTEPVKDVKERNFLIDGKNVAMIVEQYGKDIILTPYHKAAFDLDAKTLTVKGLEDYAGYKTVEKDFEIEVVEDKVAPVVTDVVAKGKVIEVTFDKDVYNDSVADYYSVKSVGNISYESGRHNVYAKEANKVDTNVVEYTFDKELPRRTVVTIVDVQNHSKVAMEKTTEEARVVLDYTEPEIIDSKVVKTSSTTADITLYFDKDVTGEFVGGLFDVSKHFEVYQRNVRNPLTGKLDQADYLNANRKDVVVVQLSGLAENDKDGTFDYILEVFDFKDTSGNKMYRGYVDFDIKEASAAFRVTSVTHDVLKNGNAEVTINLNKAVDRTRAETEFANYLFTINGKKYDVQDLDGKIIVERNGKTITLVIPKFDEYTDYANAKLDILQTLKDIDGKRLNAPVAYDFANGVVDNAEYTLSGNTVTPKAGVKVVNFTTDKTGTFTVVRNDVDLDKLVIDAPNATVVIDSGLTVDEVEVIAIAGSTLEIKGTVNTIVVSTTKAFNVVATSTNFVVESTVSTATVNVVNGTATTKVIVVKDVPQTIVVPAVNGEATFEDQAKADAKAEAKVAADEAIAKLIFTTENSIANDAVLKTAKDQVATANAAVKAYTDLGGKTEDLTNYGNIGLQEAEITRYEAAAAAAELAKVTDEKVKTVPNATEDTKEAIETAMLVLANEEVAEGYTVTIEDGSSYTTDTKVWAGKFTVTKDGTTVKATDTDARSITVVIAAE